MKAGTYAKRIAAAILLTICLLGGMDLSDGLLMELNAAYHDPKLPKGSVDVSFIGTSHQYCAIIPQLLMDEYGITAMDNAIPLLLGRDTVQLFRLVAEESKPKIAVIDLYAFMGPYTMTAVDGDVEAEKTDEFYVSHERLSQSRSWLDWKKYRLLAQDLRAMPQALPYASPTFMLHHRFADSPGRNLYYGYAAIEKTRFLYFLSSDVAHGPGIIGGSPSERAAAASAKLYEPYYAMLDELVSIGKQYDIQLIFTLLPHSCPSAELVLFEQIRDYLSQENAAFVDIDTVTERSGLDSQNDFMDGTHLNYLGAAKVTRFWGDYLAERYPLPDRRLDDDPKYDAWKIYPYSYEGDYAASMLPKTDDYRAYFQLLEKLSANHIVMVHCGAGQRNAQEHSLYQALKKGASTPFRETDDGCFLILKGSQPYYETEYSDELLYLDYIQQDGYKIDILRGSHTNLSIENVKVNVDGQGMSIVVYDALQRKVVDSVCLEYDGLQVELLRDTAA